MERLHSKLAFSSVASATFLAIGLLIHSFGNRQFGGMDCSIPINAGYRLWLGQIPYKDFFVTAPPLFFLGAGWAFQLFGVTWDALVSWTIAYFVVMGVLQLVLLVRSNINPWMALLIVTAVHAMTSIEVSYPWYNPLTAVAGAVTVSAVYCVMARPRPVVNWLLLTGALVVTALSKPNVAGPLLVLSFVTLFIQTSHRTRLITVSIGSTALTLLLLIAHKVDVLAMISSYLSASSRGRPTLARFMQDISVQVALFWLFLSLCIVIPTFFFLYVSETRWILKTYCLGLVAIGMIAFFTNGEHKIVDMPILFMALVISTRTSDDSLAESSPHSTILLLAVGLLLTLSGVALGHQRFRVYSVGPGLFYEDPPEYLVGRDNSFFATMKAGPTFISSLKEIREVLERFRSKYHREPKVFFGTRMEFGYAAFRIPPPRRQPIFWWNNGVSYHERYYEEIIRQFRQERFDMCILRRDEFLFIPDEIRGEMETRSTRRDTALLTVFLRESD